MKSDVSTTIDRLHVALEDLRRNIVRVSKELGASAPHGDFESEELEDRDFGGGGRKAAATPSRAGKKPKAATKSAKK